TPEHLAFLVTDRGGGADAPLGLASGDFVFVGDLGRPDLLETAAGQAGAMLPAARRLHQTVLGLDRLPEFVQVWPGHGAGSACGKALGAVPVSTIGYEKRFNPAIRAAQREEDFVRFILADQPEPPLYFANMKRDNKLGPRVLGALPQPRRLSAEELAPVDARRSALIDTRGWSAFRSGHVPGALWIPLARSFTSDAGSFIREDEEIVLIVEPERLVEAVRDLVRIGLDRVSAWATPGDVDALARGGGAVAALPEVGVEQARELIERGEVSVLDVRRASEFAEGRIPGAVNIAHTRLAAHLEQLPRDRTLLVNCRSGGRSGRACAFLQRDGRRVVNLAGGMLAWDAAAAPPSAFCSTNREKAT
ncbi:MAG TPA: rhodanese-like domain-containing protein, partial [Phycisphaerae bacterium]|nr:rhodanese-like domain-containing protein [Phycisphaerae bacterium]